MHSHVFNTLLVCLVYFSARQKFVRRAWEKAEVNKKWEESNWAKKIGARKKVCKMILNLICYFRIKTTQDYYAHLCWMVTIYFKFEDEFAKLHQILVSCANICKPRQLCFNLM